MAVTKKVGLDITSRILEAGITEIGENRVEGFINKQSKFANEANINFIGSLQTRKVKLIVNEVDYIHSLDRYSLAEEIEKHALNPVKCFIQINTSREKNKHGLLVEDVNDFLNKIYNF